ncbi:hypothetical protein FAI40_06615 [Acetobacteraceae bacterium]|nr:hypothetical protein FAI40_06615 [Acetobacteraceae bacterium]
MADQNNLSANQADENSTAISDGASVAPTGQETALAALRQAQGVFAAGIATPATTHLVDGATVTVTGTYSGNNAGGAVWNGTYYNSIVDQTGSSNDITIEAGTVTSKGGFLEPNGTYAGDATVNVGAGDVINGVTINGGAISALAGGTVDNAVAAASKYAGGLLGAGAVNFSGAITADGAKAVVNGATANSGAIIQAINDGTVDNAVVNASGVAVAGTAGVIDGAAVNAGGVLSASGGVVDNAAVNGGLAVASAGGIMDSASAISGGIVQAASGGIVNHAEANANGIVQANSGVVNGVDVAASGTAYATAGGIVNNANVAASGTAYATAGGFVDGATLAAGASVYATGGGVIEATDSNHNVSGAQIQAGGSGLAENGGTLAGLTMSGSPEQDAGVNGLKHDATPAMATAQNGGIIDGVTMAGAGTLVDGSGGLVSGLDASAYFSNPGALYGNIHGVPVVTVSGGSLVDATINGAAGTGAGATLNVLAGGQVENVAIGTSAVANVGGGGFANHATALGGGTVEATGSGVVDGGTAEKGGTLVAVSGGTLVGGMVQDGGQMLVSNGGVLEASGGGAVIDSAGVGGGGTLLATDGGVVKDINLSGIGSEVAGAGIGDLKGGVVLPGEGGSNIVVSVESQGVLSNVSVGMAATANVGAGGTIQGGVVEGQYSSNALGAFGATVAFISGASAVVNVNDGGVANHETVSVFGTMNANNGANLSNDTAVGGTVNVNAGAVVSNVQVSAMIDTGGILGFGAKTYDGVVNVSGAGAVVDTGLAGASGTLQAVSGGKITDAIAAANGTVFANAGGDIQNAIAQAGGSVQASGAAAVVNNATAEKGGTVIATGLGMVNGGTLLDGGTLLASSGGILDAGDSNHNLIGGTASNGGTILASNGGTVLNGAIVGSGSEYAGGSVISIPLATGAPVYATVGNGGVFSNFSAGAGGTVDVGNGGRIEGIQAQGLASDLQISGVAGIYSGGSVIINVDGGGTIDGGEVGIYGTVNETGDKAAVNNVTLGGSYLADADLPLVSRAWGGYVGATMNVAAAGATASNITVDGGALAQASAAGATILGGTAVGTAGGNGGHAAGGVIAAQANGAVVEGATALSGGIIVAGTSGATAGGTAYAGGTITLGANGGLAALIHPYNGEGAVISNATLFSGATLYSSGAEGLLGIGQRLAGSGLVAGATYSNITFNDSQALVARQGSMFGATANAGANAAFVGSGIYVSGATALGGITNDGNGSAGTYQGASIDAINGGTVLAGTAMSGGALVAGGVKKLGDNPIAALISDPGDGISLVKDGHIMGGGFGMVGGNSNLVVKKNGSSLNVDGAGIFSDAVVDAHGMMDVNGSGTFNGGTVAGFALGESGGTIENALFSGAADGGQGGVNAYLDTGAVANNNTIESGAVMSLGGGVGMNNTVQAGGVMAVGGGNSYYISQGGDDKPVIQSGADIHYGTAISTLVGDNGTNVVQPGGVDSHATVAAGGTMQVQSGAVAYAATVMNGMDTYAGGTMLTDSLGDDGVQISAGANFSDGTLVDGAGDGKTPVVMGGLIRVEPGATVTDLYMGHYGQIEVVGVQSNAGESVTYAHNTITLMSDGVGVWSATLAGAYNPSSFQVWDDNGTATIVYDTCFLRGTLISTPRGKIAVQDLKEGETIWAMVDGKQIEREITSVRHETNKLDKTLPVDLAGWAVCVKAGAFGDNLPERDLRVTAEHSFLFEGRFVPVRMLVNGRTIFYDTSLPSFEYFHLETEPHSVIIAEGVLTESWLNTEDRRQVFNVASDVARLDRIPSRSWEKDAAAPQDVSAGFVGRIWKQIEERAVSENVPAVAGAEQKFTKNPALSLRLDDGKLLKATKKRGNQYFFQIPAGRKAEALVSKVFRPSESVGPWMDDRRQLGVLVGKMTVGLGEGFRSVEAHHQVANAQGWDVVENSPCRWTKGNAVLPMLGNEEELRFGYSLLVEVLAGGPYPEQESAEDLSVSFQKEA